MAPSIDEESLAEAFIRARDLDASLGEQPSAFVTLAEAAAQAAPLATNFIEKTLRRADRQPIWNITYMELALMACFTHPTLPRWRGAAGGQLTNENSGVPAYPYGSVGGRLRTRRQSMRGPGDVH
jgi:hypothetical protein